MRRVTCVTGLLVAVLLHGAVASAQPSGALEDYALFALDSYRGHGSHIVSGDVGVNSGTLVSTGTLEAPTSRLVADVVMLTRESRCAAMFANGASVKGGGCGPAAPFAGPLVVDLSAACRDVESFQSCDRNRPVPVGHDAVVDLQPGVYGDVVVSGGGQGPGTLRLAGGTYTFCSLTTSRRSRIVANAPVEIDVTGAIRLGNGTSLAPASSGGDASDVTIQVAGDAVRFARNATVVGLLCAPVAELRLFAGVDLTGRFVARRIRSDRVTVRGVQGAPASTTTTSTASTSTSTSSTTASTSSTTSSSTIPGSTTTTTSVVTTSTTTSTTSSTSTTAPVGSSTTTTTSSPSTSTTSSPSTTTTTPSTSSTTQTTSSTTTSTTTSSTTHTTSSTTTSTTTSSTTTTTLGGATCTGGGISARVVIPYAQVGAPGLSGVRFQLAYPASLSLPTIPGTTFVDSSRLTDLTGANGFLVAQTSNDVLDVLYGVTGTTFPSGDFADVQFDCTGGSVAVTDFHCTVVSASDQVGNDVPNPGTIPCSVGRVSGL